MIYVRRIGFFVCVFGFFFPLSSFSRTEAEEINCAVYRYQQRSGGMQEKRHVLLIRTGEITERTITERSAPRQMEWGEKEIIIQEEDRTEIENWKLRRSKRRRMCLQRRLMSKY